MKKEKESSRDTVMLRVYSQQIVNAFIHVMNYVLPVAQAIQPLNVIDSGYALFVVFSSKDADYNKEVIMFAEAGDDKQPQLYKATKGLVMYEDNVINIASYERIVYFVKDYCALLRNIVAFKEGSFIYRDRPIEATVLPTRRQLIAKVRKLLNEAIVIESEKIQASLRSLGADYDIDYDTEKQIATHLPINYTNYVKESQPDIHAPIDNTAGDTSIIIHIESDAALIWFKALIEYLDLFTDNFVYDDLANGIGAARILNTSEVEIGLKNDGAVVYSYADRAKYDHPSFNDCERVILDTGKSFRQFIVDNHVQLRRLSFMCENYNNVQRVGSLKTYIELLEAVDKILGVN